MSDSQSKGNVEDKNKSGGIDQVKIVDSWSMSNDKKKDTNSSVDKQIKWRRENMTWKKRLNNCNSR